MPPRRDSLLESPLKFPDLGKSVFFSVVHRAAVWQRRFLVRAEAAAVSRLFHDLERIVRLEAGRMGMA